MTSDHVASCGHNIGSMDEGFAVEYHSEDCDAVEGFMPCIVYATYCRACVVELAAAENFISARSLAEDANTVGRQRPSKSHDAGSNPAGHANSCSACHGNPPFLTDPCPGCGETAHE